MRLYISGKITGNDYYKENFAAARAQLENAGFDVFDPAAVGFPEGVSWTDAMKYVIKEMVRCDGLAMLPGWKDSKGACIEARLARDLEMLVKPVREWLR